jgi:hypothetical protein
MCAIWEGAMRRSSPIRARPVVLTRDSPCAVKGKSVVEVYLPMRDHSVSPERFVRCRSERLEGEDTVADYENTGGGHGFSLMERFLTRFWLDVWDCFALIARKWDLYSDVVSLNCERHRASPTVPRH